MSSAPSKMLKLRSSENEIFELDETAALQSQTLKHMIEDGCADSVIPVPNVTSKILKKVIEYLDKHAETDMEGLEKNVEVEALKAFDAKFVDVDQDILFPIILAANYLSIKTLLKLACQAVADMARGKTVQEIRKHFNLPNDLTPEEKEQIRLENAWAFDHDRSTETPKDKETQDSDAEEAQDSDAEEAQDSDAEEAQDADAEEAQDADAEEAQDAEAEEAQDAEAEEAQDEQT